MHSRNFSGKPLLFTALLLALDEALAARTVLWTVVRPVPSWAHARDGRMHLPEPCHLSSLRSAG